MGATIPINSGFSSVFNETFFRHSSPLSAPSAITKEGCTFCGYHGSLPQEGLAPCVWRCQTQTVVYIQKASAAVRELRHLDLGSWGGRRGFPPQPPYVRPARRSLPLGSGK